SVYTIARSRRGKNTAPDRLRMTASNSARARMKTSAIRKYSMLRTNFFAIAGKVSLNSWPLKKACLTAGQFAECPITHTSANTTATVLTRAMATPFAPSWRSVSPNKRERRLPSGGPALSISGSTSNGFPELTSGARDLLLEHRHGADVRLLRQPLVLELLQGPVVLHGGQGQVHALDQVAALLEGHGHVVGGSPCRIGELPHHHAVLDLLDVG